MNFLAKLLFSQGAPAEALPLLEEALAGYRATLGEEHPSTQNAAKGVAMLRQHLRAE